MYQVGDRVVYRTNTVTTGHGTTGGETKTGTITEVFPSLDGSYLCFWIDGEPKLIVESQIIRKKSFEDTCICAMFSDSGEVICQEGDQVAIDLSDGEDFGYADLLNLRTKTAWSCALADLSGHFETLDI